MRVEIVSARPEDTDFIAWIIAQGMHMDGVPPFLKKLGARDDTLYSWQNTRLLQCDANWLVVLSPTTVPHMRKGEGIPG